jgi:hypothetical protein
MTGKHKTSSFWTQAQTEITTIPVESLFPWLSAVVRIMARPIFVKFFTMGDLHGPNLTARGLQKLF